MKIDYSSIKPLVIAYYKKHGNMAKTARHFNINKKTVKAWLVAEEVEIKQINIDIINQRYGRLLVKGCVGKDNNGKFLWKCDCDCGGIKTARGNDLRQGKIKSCGCLHKETSAMNGKRGVGKPSPNRKYCGEMSGKYYSQVRHNALVRGFEFHVTKDFLWELFLKQNRRCSLSNLELIMNDTASIDRIDSCGHYTEDNVQWIHKDINRMKFNYDESYFLKMCKLITEHKKQKEYR